MKTIYPQALSTLLCGSLALLGQTANAGNAANPDSSALDNVTVTAEKMPRSFLRTTTAVTVLGGDEIDQGQLESVNEVANRVPNMHANPTGGVNIRGVEGTGPAVGVNSFISGGRPRISTSIDGATEVWAGQQYLDSGLWDVQQVEVLRGPQSTTQGRNAIGGAMVIKTKDPAFHHEGAARLGWATADGRATLAAMVSGPLRENELAFRLSADGVKGHGYIDYPGDWPVDLSQIRHYSLRGKLLWTPSALPGLTAKLTVSHRDYEGQYMQVINSAKVEDYTFSRNRFSNSRYQESDNTTTTADISYQLNDNTSAHFTYSYGDNHLGFEQVPRRMSLTLDEKSHTAEARLVHRQPARGFSGVLGAYYYDRQQTLLARTNVFDGTDQLNTLALYGDASTALSDKLDLLFGARVERESQDRNVLGWGRVSIRADIAKTVFLPKVGFSYQLAPQSMLAFTARKGYNPGAGMVDDTDRYYEFDSESVKAYELSLKSRLAGVLLTGNLFYNDYDGYQASHDGRLHNIPKGRTYGLELTADANLTGTLQLYGTLGLLNSKVMQAPDKAMSIKGNAFTYAPELSASLGVKKYWGNFHLGADVNHVGKYFTDMANDPQMQAGQYTVVNLQSGYELGNTTLRAFVKNVFNEGVITRRFSGNRGNDYYVGAPRTIGVNADYRF